MLKAAALLGATLSAAVSSSCLATTLADAEQRERSPLRIAPADMRSSRSGPRRRPIRRQIPRSGCSRTS